MVLQDDRAAGASRRRPLGPISPNVDGRPSDRGAPDGFKVNRPKRSPHASLVEKLASQGAKSAANAVAASSAAIKSKRKAQQEKLASQGAKRAANAELFLPLEGEPPKLERPVAPQAAPAPAPSPPASTTAAATTPTTTTTTTTTTAAASTSTSTATLKIGSLSASSLPFQPLPYSTRKSSPNSTLSMAASRLAELAACSATSTTPATAPAGQTASASASVASSSSARAPPPCTPPSAVPSAGHSSAASDVSDLSVVSTASAVSTASRLMDGYFNDAAVLIQSDFEELRGAQAKELERLKASHQRTVAELTSFRNWCVHVYSTARGGWHPSTYSHSVADI